MFRQLTAATLACVLAASFAHAEETKKAQADNAPEGEKQKVKVVSVSGPADRVAVVDGKETYKPLKSGEELDELTVIRTGPRANVVLMFADRAEVTIKGISKMGVRKFRRSGDVYEMRLGLKYGQLRADVRSVRGPNNFQIATPVATLAASGCILNCGFDAIGGLWMQVAHGKWTARTFRKTRGVSVGEGAATKGGRVLPHIEIVGDQRFAQVTDAFAVTDAEKIFLIRTRGAQGPLAFQRFNNRLVVNLQNSPSPLAPSHTTTRRRRTVPRRQPRVQPRHPGNGGQENQQEPPPQEGIVNGDRDTYYP